MNIEDVRQTPTHARGFDLLEDFKIFFCVDNPRREHDQQFVARLRFRFETEGCAEHWNIAQERNLARHALALFRNQTGEYNRLTRVGTDRRTSLRGVNDW